LGRFTVNCDVDRAFEVLVGACGELKAKTHDIDSLRRRIDGKSRTTAWRWRTKFHARVIKSFSATVVEIYDTVLMADDRFIKELYKTFTKYQAASPLEIVPSAKVVDAMNEVEEYLDSGKQLPAEGAPLMEADIPDEAEGSLPTGRVCRKCKAANPQDGTFCNSCGTSLAGCPACGHQPEEGASFCTKCGTKLD
jgi:ribosomal protein L40E